MAPPVAVIVIVGVATSAAAVYIIKEAWEPHIRPELQKASLAAKTWWNSTSRRPTNPLRSRPVLFQRRRREEAPSAETSDDSSSLERLVDSVIHDWGDGENQLRSRKNRTPSSGAVEMMEIDKSDTLIPHVPITPVTATAGTPHAAAQSSGPSIPADPFADILPDRASRLTYTTGLNTPPASVSSPLSPTDGLLLSFPTSPQTQSLAPGQSVSNRTVLDVPFYERSPWSDTSALSASVFSWTDGADDEDETRAFSIGSFDGSSPHAQSDNEDEDGREGIETPPHNSSSEDGGSVGRGPASVGSWESVGSPSSESEGGRRLQ